MRLLRWLLLLLLLSQVPFCFQLYQSRNLSQYLERMEPGTEAETPFDDWTGGFHVHSAAGGHSLGTYPEILEAARQCDYDFVFISEHPRSPLFVPVSDPEIVMVYGWEKEIEGGLRIITDEQEKLRVLTDFEGETVPDGFQGLEVINLHEAGARSDNWFNRLNFIYHQFAYSDLFFFHLWHLDREKVQLWDETLARRPLAAFAGNDAHQNVGLILQTADGKRLFALLVDPYAYSLRFVTTHLQTEKGVDLDESTVITQMESGAFYLALERICDPTGFSFHAVHGGRVHPMGSQVPSGADLVFQAPVKARFLLYRSGEAFRELEGSRFVLEGAKTGNYRVEVYPLDPPSLLQGEPWILSNPIYVE